MQELITQGLSLLFLFKVGTQYASFSNLQTSLYMLTSDLCYKVSSCTPLPLTSFFLFGVHKLKRGLYVFHFGCLCLLLLQLFAVYPSDGLHVRLCGNPLGNFSAIHPQPQPLQLR